MESQKEKRLRLWKARQEAEGHDVSSVTTLEQAEHFFDKKEPAAEPENHENQEAAAEESEIPEVPEAPAEEPAEPKKTERPKRQRANKPKEV